MLFPSLSPSRVSSCLEADIRGGIKRPRTDHKREDRGEDADTRRSALPYSWDRTYGDRGRRGLYSGSDGIGRHVLTFATPFVEVQSACSGYASGSY